MKKFKELNTGGKSYYGENTQIIGSTQLCPGVNEDEIIKLIDDLLLETPEVIYNEHLMLKHIMQTTKGRWNPSVIIQIVQKYAELKSNI
jgi:Glu-tRNA(Gln) amidotransferase subunit E-like FAD-binding protein